VEEACWVEPKTRLQPCPASQPMQLPPRARCRPVGGTGRDGNGQGRIREAWGKKMSWSEIAVAEGEASLHIISRRQRLAFSPNTLAIHHANPSYKRSCSMFLNLLTLLPFAPPTTPNSGRPAVEGLLFCLFFALVPRPKQSQRRQHHEQQQQ